VKDLTVEEADRIMRDEFLGHTSDPGDDEYEDGPDEEDEGRHDREMADQEENGFCVKCDKPLKGTSWFEVMPDRYEHMTCPKE
jgi:hypothetical protein